MEGNHGGVEQVADFVRELTGSFNFVRGSAQPADAAVRSDRLGGRGIERPVERVKFIHGNRRVLFDGDLGNGLTNVAVVMDHL